MKQRSLYVYYNNIIRNAIRHGEALGGMTPEMITLETVARSAIDKLLREGYVPPEAYEPKNILSGKLPGGVSDSIQRYAREGLVFHGRQLAASRPEAITISTFLRCVYAMKTTHRVYQASLDEMLEFFERGKPIRREEVSELTSLLLKIQERREAEIAEYGKVSREVAMLSTPAFIVAFVAHSRKVSIYAEHQQVILRQETFDDLLSSEVINLWLDEVGTDEEGRTTLGIRRIGMKSQTWFLTSFWEAL